MIAGHLRHTAASARAAGSGIRSWQWLGGIARHLCTRPAVSHWTGEVAVGPVPLKFVVSLDPTPGASSTISIPSQGVADVALVLATPVDPAVLRFEIAGVASFEAFTMGDGTAAGAFRQGGAQLGLTMQEVSAKDAATAAAVTPPVPAFRPQHPSGELPYESVEVTYLAGPDECELVGTLTLPPGSAPVPAVLMLTGSGSHDRDETIFEHKPFLVIADYLARHGIASLRVDDRGVGASSRGSAVLSTLTFAEDAKAGLAVLQAHERVDEDRVGLLGHSEGGLTAAIAAAAAAAGAAPHFIVLLAGPGLDGRSTLLSQNRAMFESMGATPQAVDAVVERMAATLDAVAAGSSAGQIQAEVRALIEAQMAAGLSANSAGADKGAANRPEVVSDEAVASHAEMLCGPWMRTFIALDPADFLARTECPVLALCGEKDLQVLSQLHLPAIEASLANSSAPNPHSEVVSLPGLNHLLQVCETGAVDEYVDIEETISPAVLQRLRDWISSLPPHDLAGNDRMD